MPMPIGRPYPIKPAHELMGEMLLEIGKPDAAARHFARSLERIANRSLSVLGLARALTKLGREADARRQYARLVANWQRADPDLEELAEARAGAGSEPVPTEDAAVPRDPRALVPIQTSAAPPVHGQHVSTAPAATAFHTRTWILAAAGVLAGAGGLWFLARRRTPSQSPGHSRSQKPRRK
jgi:hypothetical protein